MKKRIQLIALASSFALSISISLVSQEAALASENNSDKTKWLTNSLEEAQESNQVSVENSSVNLQALSARMDNKKSNSIVVKSLDTFGRPVKLRTFMPNRKLPSRHDMEMAFIEQRAQLAAENNARLNGQVSTFVNDASTSSYQEQDLPYIKPAIRTNRIRNSQTVARTTRQAHPQEPIPVAKSPAQSFSFMRQAEQHLLSTMTAPQASVEQFNSPPAAAFSQSQPITSQPAPQASAYGTAGPPPFPLNLLPEAALKQLIRSMASGMTSRAGSAPRSAFGSWHNNSRISNLPVAGFQSYAGRAHSNFVHRTSRHHISALPAVTAYPMRSKSQNTGRQNTNKTNSKDTAARNRLILESQVRVATYPAYATQSLRPWSFAQ